MDGEYRDSYALHDEIERRLRKIKAKLETIEERQEALIAHQERTLAFIKSHTEGNGT